MLPEFGGMGYLLNYGIVHSDPGIWWNEWRRYTNVSFEPKITTRMCTKSSAIEADLASYVETVYDGLDNEWSTEAS